MRLVGLVSKSKSDLYIFMKLLLPTIMIKLPEDGGPTTIKVFYPTDALDSLALSLAASSQTFDFCISAGSLIMCAVLNS